MTDSHGRVTHAGGPAVIAISAMLGGLWGN